MSRARARYLALGGLVACLVVVAIVILVVVAVLVARARPNVFTADGYHALLVERVNAATNATWTARLNKFAVRAMDQVPFYPSTEELQRIFPRMLEIDNYAKDVLLSGDIARHLVRLAVIQSVPEHFDAREEWPLCWSIRHVSDQGECGSCWAVAVVTSISDRICIQSNGALQPLLSVQQLISCCDYCGTCQGTMEPFGSFYYWLTDGIVTGGQSSSFDGCWPYEMKADCGHPCSPQHYVKAPRVPCRTTCKRHPFSRSFDEDKYYAAYAYRLGQFRNIEDHATLFSKYKVLINSSSMEDLLKRELLTFGPVVMCFDVYEEFLHYLEGVYQPVNDKDTSLLYGHCVKIIGWGSTPKGVKYLLALNSWSQKWGENGSFRIRIDSLLNRKGDFFAGVPKPNF